jgi:hypothetical protein
VFDRVGGFKEPVKAHLLQLTPKVGNRIVGQQHHRVLVHVLAQILRVEVVGVQVRDVEIVAVAERVPVQGAVVGKREPRGEICRVDPGVAQDASGLGVDPETRMSDARDLH